MFSDETLKKRRLKNQQLNAKIITRRMALSVLEQITRNLPSSAASTGSIHEGHVKDLK